MYCGLPGPFCSFILLLRGWPGDLHAGSCYGPGYCSAPEPGSQLLWCRRNTSVCPHATLQISKWKQSLIYKDTDTIHVLWHVYVLYIYIYTFRMEHCEQFHCHLRDPKGILCAGQVAVGIVPQLLLLDLPPLARPLPRHQHLPTHRPPLHSASKEFAEARRQRIFFLSNM